MGIFTKLAAAAFMLSATPFAFAQLGAPTEDLEIERQDGPAEIRGQVRARPIALFFAGIDSSGDKIVSRAELQAGIAREWRMLKPSISGKIGAFKMEDWALATLGARDAYPSRLSFDSNLDNQVSQEEFTSRLTRSFDALDENGDGRLSRAELVFMAAPQIVRKEARREEQPRRQQRQRGY